MNNDSARRIIVAAIKSSSMLTSLSPIMRDLVDIEAYSSLSKRIGSIAFDINEEIIEFILEKHPSLRGEIDMIMERGDSIDKLII